MVQLLVNVDVDDIERAIEFYRAAIGLHLGRRLFDGSVAEMLGASIIDIGRRCISTLKLTMSVGPLTAPLRLEHGSRRRLDPSAGANWRL